MPSPEFRRSFPIGKIIFVLTFRMRSVVPVEILSNHNKAAKIAYFASVVHANCCSRWRTELENFNIQSGKQQQRDDDLRSPPMPAIYANCFIANCEFALHGVRYSWFSTSNQNSSKKETITHDRPCELLVNCEFALRGSESFRSSEPKETNALNACNVKWPVHSTGCC